MNNIQLSVIHCVQGSTLRVRPHLLCQCGHSVGI